MKDELCREVTKANPNMLVPWYLMTSILYYQYDTSIVSDGCYDALCGRLLLRWRQVTHRHKRFIDKEALRAGTGFQLKHGGLPTIITSAAFALVD